MRRVPLELLASIAILILCIPMRSSCAAHDTPAPAVAEITAAETNEACLLTWRGDEVIEVTLSKSRGIFQTPFMIRVNGHAVRLGGIYVHINEQKDGFVVQSTHVRLHAGCRQPRDRKDGSKFGNRIDLRPAEMREVLRYEIALSPGTAR